MLAGDLICDLGQAELDYAISMEAGCAENRELQEKRKVLEGVAAIIRWKWKYFSTSRQNILRYHASTRRTLGSTWHFRVQVPK